MIRRWLHSLAPAGQPVLPGRQRVARARNRLAAARRSSAAAAGSTRQLLVDISVIAGHDGGTGIQRTVRAVLTRLLAAPPPGCIVRPVAATRHQPYRYIAWEGAPAIVDHAITVAPGDLFLGLDLALHALPRHDRQLAAWKRQGLSIHVLVYDLLPLLHPEWFSGQVVGGFRRWIESIAILADSALCISQATADDLHNWLEREYGVTGALLPSTVIPMGRDIAASRPSAGLPADFDGLTTRIGGCPTLLLVGTLEPRKGHAQVVDAMERLWAMGRPYNLVIVGRPGWKTEVLQQRLRQHPELGNRLFWLDNASDQALQALYRCCTGVVVASQGEGFGLPLIEALDHGKPVLARDLQVFRMHGFRGVDYFHGNDGGSLATTIDHWLPRIAGTPPLPPQPLPGWEDTVTALVGALCPPAPARAGNSTP